MRRLLLSLAVVVAASLGLSACDVTVTPYAAKVDSATISTATLNQSLAAIASDSGLQCFIATSSETSGGAPVISVKGRGSGNFGSAFAASELTSLIDQQELQASLNSLGLHANSTDDGLATEQLVEQFTPTQGSTCKESGSATLAALSSSYRNFSIASEVSQDLLAAHLAGVPLTLAGLSAYVAKDPSESQIACFSAIVTSTLANADSARAAIAQGASFAAVAKAKSIDSSSAPGGGVIGCFPPSDLESPLGSDLASVATGVVSKAFSFSGEYIIFLISKRQTPTSLDVVNAIVQTNATAVRHYVASLATRAHVTVDARYGTWEKESGSWLVVPPTGPSDTYVANPTAITPPSVLFS